jgi:DNA-binding MarR family transcriptional regulator
MQKVVEPDASSAAPGPATGREVVRAVADLVTLVEPRLLALWRATGMTLSQRRVLGRLRVGRRTAGELAGWLGISAPSLTRTLTKLEKQGLITRTLDEADRRRIQVELTNAGRRSLESHRVFSGTSLLRAARSLSASQQQSVAESIGTLVRLARELEVGDPAD